jgi:hypothetical protein
MLKGLSFLIYTFMDKQLLEALNNLSDSLEMISKALENKEGSNTTTTNALQSGDFSKQLTEITTSLKSIKSDTKKILEKQNTILEMQKQKDSDKKNAIDETGEDPKKQSDLKKGVTTILLIAVAVLAIGLAFKIIGKVDFLSVVSLGLAIVLIAHAFQKIAEAEITEDQAIDAGATMVIMSMAIMVSSWILSFIKPISFTQAVTAILIAGMFTVIAFGIKKLINALGENIGTLMKSILFLPLILPAIALGITLSSWVLAFINPISFAQAITAILIAGMFTVIAFGIKKLINALGADITTLGKAILFLPLILPAIALGIAASSWVLQMIVPISFTQALTGILIAAMFTVISFGIKKLIGAFKGLDPAQAAVAAILMPLLLIAMSMAIAASSFFLAQITPIGFDQFFTAIGISIVFVVLAFALKLMAPAIKKIKIGDVVVLPLLFTALSLAIMLSSKILVETTPIDYSLLFNIVVFSIVFAISAIAMGFAAFVLAKIGIKKIIEGGLCMIILAGVVAVSSLLISEGKYDNYPGWEWALGTGASILAFGLIATVFGLIIETGIGGAALALGALAIVGIAAVIVATSYILSKGKYENYPGIGWAMGVGISLTAFGLAMAGLGSVILLSFGLGMTALAAGGEAVLLIAQTIVDSAAILSKGNFTGGPTLEWAGGIALALAAFSPIYAMLAANKIMSLFGGGIGPDEFSNAIRTVSQGIADAANYFSDPKDKNGKPMKVSFKGGPTLEWAGGIALALAAFSPVYAMLAANKIMSLFGGGVGPEDFANAIRTVSQGIVDAANYFSDPKDKDGKSIKVDFKGGPPKEWAEGVGGAIAAFAPVYAALSSGGMFSVKVTPEDMKTGILTIVDGIIAAADAFGLNKSKFDLSNTPSADWGKNVGGALQAFAPVFTYMNENSGWFKSGPEAANEMVYGINTVANAIVSVANKFGKVKLAVWKSYPPSTWITNISKSIKDYVKLATSLVNVDLSSILNIDVIVLLMVATARIIHNNKRYFTTMNNAFVTSLTRNLTGYKSLSSRLANTSLIGLAKTNLVALSLVRVAKTIWSGRQFFSKSIDPNYMKNLSKNVMDYAKLANYLTSTNKNSGFFSGVKSLLGLDPISQAARGMITIAGAYDKLATSLRKFGGALSSIDGKKVNLIRNLTGNLAVLASMNQDNLENMMKTLEERASVFSKLVEYDGTKTKRPAVGDKKAAPTTPGKPGGKPKMDTHAQLDMIIQLLSNINQTTVSLDQHITGASEGNVQTKSVAGGGNSGSSWFNW